MKIRIQLALMGCLASVAAHFYLTMHYYPLKYGFAAGESVCNMNAKFNCDAAAASNYSALFGIPLSVFGMVFNSVLFVMMMISWLEWYEQPERLKRWVLLLCGASAIASVVMAVISFTQLSAYCLFCFTCYLLSFIIFFAYRGLVRGPFWKGIKEDIPALFTESQGILVGLAIIPVAAFMTHKSFVQNYGAQELETRVQDYVSAWTSSPKQELVAKPTVTMGPPPGQAAMVLSEFADFRCSHCKHASYSLDAFAKANPDVRFEFYVFPLDGACNEKVQGTNNISCRLAYADYCADKEGKGWELHDLLYKIQDDVNTKESVEALDPLLSQNVQTLGLDWEKMKTCMADPATIDAIKAQAKQGALVNVEGTPTIFVDGRLLNGGQLVPVLQAVRAKAIELKDSKK